MKKTYCIVLVLVLVLASCSKNHTPSFRPATSLRVIYDLTESLRCPPTVEPILSVFDFDNNIGQSADFKLTKLGGSLLCTQSVTRIEGLTTSIATPVDYDGLMQPFCNAIRMIFANYSGGKGGYVSNSEPRIECFATVATELDDLVASGSLHRTLIVFGSLKEINPAFDSRSAHDRDLLRNDPEKIAGLLQRRHPLPDNLVGITVFFVFQPSGQEQADYYQHMVSIYKQLLKVRGARVVIQSTNTAYSL